MHVQSSARLLYSTSYLTARGIATAISEATHAWHHTYSTPVGAVLRTIPYIVGGTVLRTSQLLRHCKRRTESEKPREIERPRDRKSPG